MTKKETTKFEVCGADHRVDRECDPDCTGSHVLHGTVNKRILG